MSDLLKKRRLKGEIVGKTRLDGIISFDAVKIDSSKIESLVRRAINQASSRIAVDLKVALDAAIRSNVWDGLQGASDIYDTGELLSSGQVIVDQNGINVFYTAPYASLVHYGGYINPYGNINARVYLPPRPWVDSVLSGSGPVEAFDFRRYYQEALDEVFG